MSPDDEPLFLTGNDARSEPPLRPTEWPDTLVKAVRERTRTRLVFRPSCADSSRCYTATVVASDTGIGVDLVASHDHTVDEWATFRTVASAADAAAVIADLVDDRLHRPAGDQWTCNTRGHQAHVGGVLLDVINYLGLPDDDNRLDPLRLMFALDGGADTPPPRLADPVPGAAGRARRRKYQPDDTTTWPSTVLSHAWLRDGESWALTCHKTPGGFGCHCFDTRLVVRTGGAALHVRREFSWTTRLAAPGPRALAAVLTDDLHRAKQRAIAKVDFPTHRAGVLRDARRLLVDFPS